MAFETRYFHFQQVAIQGPRTGRGDARLRTQTRSICRALSFLGIHLKENLLEGKKKKEKERKKGKERKRERDLVTHRCHASRMCLHLE